MAKISDMPRSRRGAVRRPPVKAPPPPRKPAGKRSKTDAERLDDLLQKSAAKEPDDRARTTGRKDD
jgi:hypothetical protein